MHAWRMHAGIPGDLQRGRLHCVRHLNADRFQVAQGMRPWPWRQITGASRRRGGEYFLFCSGRPQDDYFIEGRPYRRRYRLKQIGRVVTPFPGGYPCMMIGAA